MPEWHWHPTAFSYILSNFKIALSSFSVNSNLVRLWNGQCLNMKRWFMYNTYELSTYTGGTFLM